MAVEGRMMKSMESLSCGDSAATSLYPSAFSYRNQTQSAGQFALRQLLQDLSEPQSIKRKERSKGSDPEEGVRW